MKDIIKIMPKYRVPIVKKKKGKKKKTHEQYLSEVTIKHPNIEVVGRYIDAKTKIAHRCKLDGYEWNSKPNNILNNKGCPKCSGTMKKTHDEYVEQLISENINVEVLEKYINAKTPIMHLCKTHNVKWRTSPSNILKGSGCPECLKEKISIKNGYTHEQFVEKLKNQARNIELIDIYVNSHTPILFRCLIDEYEWMGIPSNILVGQGCPKCAGNIKKTHEEYTHELFLINPHIEILEEYVNSNFPILHKCNRHNIEWKSSPSNMLKGYGCCKCGNEKTGEKLRKTQEQYVKELKNTNVIILGKYVNTNTPTLHKCIIHNVEWTAKPCDILLGHGCFKCKSEKISNKLRKTHEQYIKDLENINPDVIAIDKYIDVNTPILHMCLKDNYQWSISPHNLLNGTGCPKCMNRFYRTHDEYVCEVKNINNNIEVIDNFINTYTPILHKCSICNHQWLVRPTNILLGSGCPKCAQNIQKTHFDYVNELSLLNLNIEVIGTYVNSYTPILHKCLIDNHKWLAKPTNILSGKGCPRCKESHGEKQIRQWLNGHNVLYEKQYKFDDCYDIKPLPFDFYLPKYNLCIEYDGEQHFRPVDFFGGEKHFKLQQKHDNIKNEYCKNNGILLLRIPYYKNIEEELNNFLFI